MLYGENWWLTDDDSIGRKTHVCLQFYDERLELWIWYKIAKDEQVTKCKLASKFGKSEMQKLKKSILSEKNKKKKTV